MQFATLKATCLAAASILLLAGCSMMHHEPKPEMMPSQQMTQAPAPAPAEETNMKKMDTCGKKETTGNCDTKSTAKKSTAKKSTAKKSTAKKSSASAKTSSTNEKSAATPASKSTAKKSSTKKHVKKAASQPAA